MTTVSLLDHGSLSLVESWGSDERIIEAARMSTAKGFQGWGSAKCRDCGRDWESVANWQTAPRCESGRGGGHTIDDDSKRGDEKLLRFLYENKHSTPFEMAGLIVEVKAPIFIFREWVRHRTQSYAEMSARYVPLPDENYTPSLVRVMAGGQSASNKQASGEPVPEVDALEWLAELADVYAHAQRVYESGIRRGIAKELARLPVPVARYSRMRASANLRNWLGFLALRDAPNVQWEFRPFARAVGSLIAAAFPRTWALFSEGRTP